MADHALIAFLHIPKTAGTTVNRALRLHYDSLWQVAGDAVGLRRRPTWREHVATIAAMSPHERARVAYLRGRHFGYGVHEQLDVPVRYLTMLRDPVDRLVSSYHYTAPASGPDIPLAQFAREGRTGDRRHYARFPDNAQVRALAGEGGVQVSVPVGQCTPAMADLAIERLDHHVELAGLNERFDESMLLLGGVLGWPQVRYVTSNVNTARPSSPAHDDETVEALRAANELDQRLHDHAAVLLEQRIAAWPGDFEAELAAMRSANDRHNARRQPLYRTYSRVTHLLSRR